MTPPARFAPSTAFAALSYVVVAIALRLPVFGDPVVDVDEQFYLLVGDRMRSGALPFVDLWDRKPAGLFALYELFAATGHGPVATHLAALVCVLVTALMLRSIASYVASPVGAWLAGLIYPIYLSAFHCFGGQTPVFYDLAMAAAALILTGLVADIRSPRPIASGIGVMALVGIAVEIKYTVVFEGFWFGLTLIALAFRQRWPLARIAGASALWFAAALLPTLAVVALYWHLGHLDDWIASNVLSNFGRRFSWGDWLDGLSKAALTLAALGIAAALGLIAMVRDRARSDGLRLFLAGWLAFAVGGFLLVGTYFDHYRAPLLLPLAVMSASALGLVGIPLVVTAVVGAIGLMLAIPRVYGNRAERGDAAQIAGAAALITPALRHGCLYVYEGDPALYRLTGSCLPSRYVFPGHLSWPVEAGTLGVDPRAEMRRILATHPAVVVTGDDSFVPTRDGGTWSVLAPALKQEYVLASGFPMGRQEYRLYYRRDRASPGP